MLRSVPPQHHQQTLPQMTRRLQLTTKTNQLQLFAGTARDLFHQNTWRNICYSAPPPQQKSRRRRVKSRPQAQTLGFVCLTCCVRRDGSRTRSLPAPSATWLCHGRLSAGTRESAEFLNILKHPTKRGSTTGCEVHDDVIGHPTVKAGKHIVPSIYKFVFLLSQTIEVA